MGYQGASGTADPAERDVVPTGTALSVQLRLFGGAQRRHGHLTPHRSVLW